MKYKIEKIDGGVLVRRSDQRVVSICRGANAEELAQDAIERDILFPQTAGRKVLFPTAERIGKVQGGDSISDAVKD